MVFHFFPPFLSETSSEVTQMDFGEQKLYFVDL